MKPPPFAYLKALDVKDAVAKLAQEGPDAKVLAGGQSLIPLLNFRLARPTALVDVSAVHELDYIRQENGHLAIGATTRQRTLETSEVAAASVPLLRLALRHVGHVTNRNRGTVGGSVAHADPSAELPAVVTALGGDLVLTGPEGTRTVGADDFFVSTFTSTMAPDELLTEVRLPRLPQAAGVAVEELARRHGDFALVTAVAAVQLDADGRVALARLALGGVDSRPVRLHAAEAALTGERPTEAALSAAVATVPGTIHPTDDVHAPASYRRDMAQVLLRRALISAIQRNGKHS